MAHWAELDKVNTVLRVIVCDADDGADGTIHPPAFCTDVLGGTWVRTYYDTPGEIYAGVGYSWDGTRFVPPPSPALTELVEDALKLLVAADVLTQADADAAQARADAKP